MKQLLPIFMMVVFLGILAGANIYLSRRFAWYFGLEHVKYIYVLFAGLTVFMIAGVAGLTNSTGFVGHVFYCTAAFLMGFLLYLLLSVLVLDLVHLFVKVGAKYHGMAVLILAVSLSAYATWNAFQLRTEEITIEMKGLDRGLRAMHLSDIHLGHFRGAGFLQSIVKLTNAQKVDMVLITGDLYDGKIRFCDTCLNPLRELNAPVYFVEGNHDGYSGVHRVKSGLGAVGVRVLSNEVSWQDGLQIIGLNHMLADENSTNMHAPGNSSTIESVLEEMDIQKDKPIILLHHSPDGIQYANRKGVDLYLAGHTHAGQLFPVNYIGELIYQFNRGLHHYNGTSIYVSPGAGTFGPPMRLGTHSTVTVINLQPMRDKK